VTTDKVYRHHEPLRPYREDDALGGHDPYSASKAASELIIASYRDAFFGQQGLALASARAGNVIGGGDWSAERLLPDAVLAWQSGIRLQIRSPQSIRPWQHVLEPLAGYLTLANTLWHHPERAGAYNFGPLAIAAATVQTVIELARTAYGDGEVGYDAQPQGPHEAAWLALEVAKAKQLLNVEPHWSLKQAIDRTIAWYRAEQQGSEARRLCAADLAAFGSDVALTSGKP
jgi:CDP-glucose 4,6-dehydratase